MSHNSGLEHRGGWGWQRVPLVNKTIRVSIRGVLTHGYELRRDMNSFLPIRTTSHVNGSSSRKPEKSGMNLVRGTLPGLRHAEQRFCVLKSPVSH